MGKWVILWLIKLLFDYKVSVICGVSSSIKLTFSNLYSFPLHILQSSVKHTKLSKCPISICYLNFIVFPKRIRPSANWPILTSLLLSLVVFIDKFDTQQAAEIIYNTTLKMNRIYLDQERVIDAEISSDASMQADEDDWRNKKSSTKNLTTQFSLYLEEVKKDINKNLSAIARQFYGKLALSHSNDNNHKQTISLLLQSWKPKIQLFQAKLAELKNNLPFFSTEKSREKIVSIKKIKFTDAIQKFLQKFESNSSILSKQNVERYTGQAQALYEQGCYQQAIEKIKKFPVSNSELCFVLGNCYKAVGLWDQAIQEYSKAIKEGPKGCYFNNRGNCYLSLQNMEKAEQDYRMAINLEPRNEIFLGNYGNVCLNLKKYEEAIVSFNIALQIGPNHFFHNNKAFAEIKLGRLNEAIESYNEAIALSSSNHLYLKNRANLHMQKGNLSQAMADINEAIQIQPNKHEYYFLRGKWEYLSHKIKQALVSFRKASQIEPNKKIYKEYYMAVRSELAYK